MLGGLSLRRDNPAQRVTPRQDDAAMIDLGGWARWMGEGWCAGSLNQCSAARGAPVVGNGLKSQDGTAVAANAFHT
jgi:hypothetical protein